MCRLDDGQMVIVRQTADVVPPTEGDTIRLSAEPDSIHLFDAVTERRVEP